MERHLGRAAVGLAQLVAGHQQPLAVLSPGGVEISLPGVGPILSEPSAILPALPLLEQADQLRLQG